MVTGINSKKKERYVYKLAFPFSKTDAKIKLGKRVELLEALIFKLKKRGGAERKPATTAHPVAGVTIFRSRAL